MLLLIMRILNDYWDVNNDNDHVNNDEQHDL